VTEPLENLYAAAAPGSPEWFLRRLHAEIIHRRPMLDLFDDYYEGDHPLPWLSSRARDEFRRILRMTRSNLMGLVIDATAERLALEGFRLPGAEAADPKMWSMWKANNLDEDFDQGILDALIGGTAYTLVQPNGTDTPDIFVEHASQAIVAYAPGSNRRKAIAGLKVWVDDWTGLLCATLDVNIDGAQWIYKFQAKAPKNGVDDVARRTQWDRRIVAGEPWPVRNPLGEVALTEIPNNPRLLTGGRSEIKDVTDAQDRINKTIADRLMTQDFGAFPALFGSGVPEDEGTEPIDFGPGRVVTTDVAETRWWQMSPAPLDPFSAAKREDAKDISSRTRVPAQYLLGEMSNVNGETLRASESGLVAKCRQRIRPFGGAAVETMRKARIAAGLPAADARMESLWRNPEFRTEGEITDAAVKQLQAGIRDQRAAREFVGMSQTEIAQIEGREDQLDPAAARIAREFQAAVGMTGGDTTAGV
jgi:hypothetical protein